jgi:GNAT superfamily N-acetyltransferase
MSDAASIEPVASPRSTSAWKIRQASGDDAVGVAAAVGELLVELGGKCPSPKALEAEAWVLLDDSRVGAVFVAEAGGEVVGVLVASRQRAMHVPGPYFLIQDLWVGREWRSRKIGADLVAAIADLAREQGIARIEVGLPRESFAGFQATEAFYARNEFEPLGLRMRRVLDD